MNAPLILYFRNASLFSSAFPTRLSRACLGKMIMFYIKMAQKREALFAYRGVPPAP
eukprot:COSAG06_NODE_72751_length_166_cov_92.313433_1_plen_55_part_11